MTDSAIPHPEHPRPIFQRDPWLTLNGRWRFGFDPKDIGEQNRWYRLPHPDVRSASSGADAAGLNFEPGRGVRTGDPFAKEIVVPFPWESRLSEIGDADYKGAAWYQRTVEVPGEWGSAGNATSTGSEWRLRPWLCFGAVDWSARVWIDGRFAGEHSGGYTPFYLDLSRHVRPGKTATLTVRAWDTSSAEQPLGKQVERWYTPSGGIWQTVWLEGRPAAHLTRIHVTPNLEAGSASFDIGIAADTAAPDSAYQLRVESVDGAFPAEEQSVTVAAGGTTARLDVQVPAPRAWSPEDPHLYDCTVTLSAPGQLDDRISTYFGLRSVSRGRWEDKPYEYVLLNGEPVYLRGALDQAFHPDALHSYPSDDAIRADVQAAKDLGLNMLRCHIKVNDPRYYYWCDRLGVLMMYDMPSCDVYTPTARANWEATFRAAFDRDYSHPSIFSWILFNETWGLEEHQTPASWAWVKEMFLLAKSLDSSRLIEDNSTNKYDHVLTDLNSWHFYIDNYRRARHHVTRVVEQTQEGGGYGYVGRLYEHVPGAEGFKQETAPLLNSEYAALSARGGDLDISYSFKFLTTELRRHDKICGYVYTELADIEWEHNGFLEYDRTAKEFGYEAFVPGMSVADLNAADFVGLDAPPCRTMRPGSEYAAPVFFSHWDRRPLDGATLRWRVSAVDRLGETFTVDEGERSIMPRRYGVAECGDVRFRLPDRPCLVTVALTVTQSGGTGAVRARNYVNVDVYDLYEGAQSSATLAPLVTSERTPGGGFAVAFAPEGYDDCSWPNPIIGQGDAKFGGPGPGWVQYAVALPSGCDPAAVKRLRLRFEAGARTARSRIGWPDPVYVKATDYPQTEARKRPTRLDVSVNGVSLGSVTLPDDPADARGVLSFQAQGNWEFGSYGYLTTVQADAAQTRRILETGDGRLLVRFEAPRGGRSGGLNLYGARAGAFPLNPTIFLDLND